MNSPLSPIIDPLKLYMENRDRATKRQMVGDIYTQLDKHLINAVDAERLISRQFPDEKLTNIIDALNRLKRDPSYASLDPKMKIEYMRKHHDDVVKTFLTGLMRKFGHQMSESERKKAIRKQGLDSLNYRAHDNDVHVDDTNIFMKRHLSLEDLQGGRKTKSRKTKTRKTKTRKTKARKTTKKSRKTKGRKTLKKSMRKRKC